MQTKQDWEWLAVCSHYQTAVAVRKFLQEGKSVEAGNGLDSLIAAMGRTEKRAVQSQLTRLMSHIIRWKCQPQHRSSSWAITILSARNEIEDSQEEVPSINGDFIELIWDKCFKKAMKEAVIEMGKKCELTSLSWEEVFEEEYNLIEDDIEEE